MDPITHGLVGLVLGLQALQGGDPSLLPGVMTASVVGSILPDLDIIFQLWGDYVYLKQHRGFSHSLLGAVLLSCAGGLLLSLFYPGYLLFELSVWMLAGMMSHLFLDLLNSYGLKIFWPFCSKKFTLNLLPLFDPLLVVLCLLGLLSLLGYNGINGVLLFVLFTIYLLIRWGIRLRAMQLLRKKYQRKKNLSEVKVNVLPCGIFNIGKWDFIVWLPQKNIVGTLNLFKGKYSIFQHLHRQSEEIYKLLAETVLGEIFLEFTPFYHISYQKKGDKLVCQFMDLRYRLKDRFLHNGTLVLNQNMEVEEAIFQPYSMAHKIYLA